MAFSKRDLRCIILQFNIWSHKYIYKYKEVEIGKLLYEDYVAKIICSEQDFIERLKYWEGELNWR